MSALTLNFSAGLCYLATAFFPPDHLVRLPFRLLARHLQHQPAKTAKQNAEIRSRSFSLGQQFLARPLPLLRYFGRTYILKGCRTSCFHQRPAL